MRALAIATLVVLTAAPAFAQGDMTQSDLQRLQDAIAVATKDVANLRARDANAGRDLQAELNDMQEEVTYLKVKLRKERTVPRSDYSDLRDRIENLQNRARGEDNRGGAYTTPAPPTTKPAPSSSRPLPPPPPPPAPASGARTGANGLVVPVGTELDVRLQTPLNSGSAQVEDRFEATTLVDLKSKDGRMLVPAGSLARGVVSAVKAAGRVERKGSLSLTFDRLTVNGVTYQIRGTLTQAVESEGVKGEAVKIGAGAAVGGILGGILGGVKGTIAGILIGGGGTMVASEGEQVDLKIGTVLRMRFDDELSLER